MTVERRCTQSDGCRPEPNAYFTPRTSWSLPSVKCPNRKTIRSSNAGLPSRFEGKDGYAVQTSVKFAGEAMVQTQKPESTFVRCGTKKRVIHRQRAWRLVNMEPPRVSNCSCAVREHWCQWSRETRTPHRKLREKRLERRGRRTTTCLEIRRRASSGATNTMCS